MSYSRRQLYAMGEPLGDCATRRKADGGLILGGGGSSPEIPAVTQQTTIADMPAWLKPFAQQTLGQAQALTEAQRTYPQYGGPRIADLSPLQQTAIQTAASPQAFGQAVQGYMSPYQQAVTDIQKREATRQYGIQAGTQAAQAVKSGAYGGSRQGIQQAEGQRNLLQQLNDIQAQGSQAAYQQAAQQANTALGQQMQLGSLQQQQQQKGLDVAYQDFLNQQNYPYQQLSFMSNLIRGTPMGMNASSQVYQPAPTTAQTIGSLGMGAYGLSQLMGAKEGGLMQSYADGGDVRGYAGDEGSVTDSGLGIIDKFNDESKMLSGMHGLSDDELQQIIDNPTTPAEAMAAQQELASRHRAIAASEANGLAGAFNQIPTDQQDSMIRAAGGGILAFAGDEEDNDPASGQMISDLVQSPGNPRLQKLYGDKMLEVINRMEKSPGYIPMTRDQTRAAERQEYEDLTRFAGEDPYAPMRRRLEEDEASRFRNLEQGKGLAALQAANAMLQPGGTIRGLAAAGATFGSAYGDVLKADRAEKRYLGQMQFNLADAERKERLGLTKEARASVQASEVAKLNAVKAGIQRDQAIGNMLGRGMQATRPVGGGGAKEPKGFDALALAEYKGLVDAGEKPGDATRRLAYRNAANIWGRQTGEDRTAIGMGTLGAKLSAQVETAQNKLRVRPEYLEASKEERKQMMDEVETRIYQNAGRSPTPSGEQKTPEKGKKDYSNLW